MYLQYCMWRFQYKGHPRASCITGSYCPNTLKVWSLYSAGMGDCRAERNRIETEALKSGNRSAKLVCVCVCVCVCQFGVPGSQRWVQFFFIIVNYISNTHTHTHKHTHTAQSQSIVTVDASDTLHKLAQHQKPLEIPVRKATTVYHQWLQVHTRLPSPPRSSPCTHLPWRTTSSSSLPWRPTSASLRHCRSSSER